MAYKRCYINKKFYFPKSWTEFKNSYKYVLWHSEDQRLKMPRSETINMRENLLKAISGHRSFSIFLKAVQCEFSPRMSISRMSLLSNTLYSTDNETTRNNSRVSSDLRGNKFYCQPAVGFSPATCSVHETRWHVSMPAGNYIFARRMRMYKRSFSQDTACQVSRIGDESRETRRVFEIATRIVNDISRIWRTSKLLVKVNRRDAYLLHSYKNYLLKKVLNIYVYQNSCAKQYCFNLFLL